MLTRYVNGVAILETMRREKWWLIFNGLAVISFLIEASQTWIEPELRVVPGASGGEAFVWGLSALPILLGAFVIDLVWLGFGIGRAVKHRDLKPMAAALTTAAVWLVVILFDGAHHGA